MKQKAMAVLFGILLGHKGLPVLTHILYITLAITAYFTGRN